MSGKFPAQRVEELKGRTGKDKILVVQNKKKEKKKGEVVRDEVTLPLQEVPALRGAPLPKMLYKTVEIKIRGR